MKDSDNGPVVSCLLETNQSQAITFKFDLREADVLAISAKMVRRLGKLASALGVKRDAIFVFVFVTSMMMPAGVD